MTLGPAPHAAPTGPRVVGARATVFDADEFYFLRWPGRQYRFRPVTAQERAELASDGYVPSRSGSGWFAIVRRIALTGAVDKFFIRSPVPNDHQITQEAAADLWRRVAAAAAERDLLTEHS